MDKLSSKKDSTMTTSIPTSQRTTLNISKPFWTDNKTSKNASGPDMAASIAERCYQPLWETVFEDTLLPSTNTRIMMTISTPSPIVIETLEEWSVSSTNTKWMPLSTTSSTDGSITSSTWPTTNMPTKDPGTKIIGFPGYHSSTPIYTPYDIFLIGTQLSSWDEEMEKYWQYGTEKSFEENGRIDQPLSEHAFLSTNKTEWMNSPVGLSNWELTCEEISSNLNQVFSVQT
jgi:hypothetical protein